MATNSVRRIEYMSVTEMMARRHPQNPKGHDLGLIAQSFLVHGFGSSGMIDDRTDLFLCGHGRAETLDMMIRQKMPLPRYVEARNGDWYGPVECGYESLNDAQALAYIVMDNESTIKGDWNEPALAELLQEVANSTEVALEATGFDADELDLLLADLGMIGEPTPDPGADVDKAAELNKKWQVQRGDVWEIPSSSGGGVHRIMCGDSTSAEDVALLMGGVKAEILFTSPPYSDQREYNGDDVNIGNLVKFIPTWKEYCNFQCVNLGIKFSNFEITEYWNDYISAARGCDLKLLAWNVWNKCEAGSVSMQMQMFAVYHEWIFVFGDTVKKLNRTVEKSFDSEKKYKEFSVDDKGRRVANRRQADGSIKKSTVGEWYDKKQLPSIISSIPEKGTLRQLHPAIMGSGLAVDYIEAMADKNDVVCDPFLGSGTTLVACEQTGRVGYGMEISPDYVAVCLERLVGMGLTPERLYQTEEGRKTK